MDVNAAIERLITALEDSDRQEAANACDDIVEWMRKGGFIPTLTFPQTDFLLGYLADVLRK